MKIVITEFAEGKLKEIFLYYKREATITIAKKIKRKIFNKIKLTIDNPSIGTEDKYLKHLGFGHRILIEGNYKIVYRQDGNIIYITDIFDSRQDPDKQSIK